MELVNYQSYFLRSIHKEDLIELVVVSCEEEIPDAAISMTNELIINVETFIDELMKEMITSAVKDFPVKCYLPCPQCKVFHFAIEKIMQTNSNFCAITYQYVDIRKYYELFTSNKYHEPH